MALARFSRPDRKALERITTAGRPGSGREGRRLFVARELAYNHSFRRRNHSPAKRSPDAGLGKLAFPLITDVGLDTSYWNRKSFILVVAGRRQQNDHADAGPSLCIPPLAAVGGSAILLKNFPDIAGKFSSKKAGLVMVDYACQRR